MSDDTTKYICARCLTPIDAGKAERVGLVLYCSGCAKEYQDDVVIAAMLKSQGGEPC